MIQGNQLASVSKILQKAVFALDDTQIRRKLEVSSQNNIGNYWRIY